MKFPQGVGFLRDVEFSPEMKFPRNMTLDLHA